ncbi:hypothetical protein D3C85_1684830 [compost metagenome]
MLANAARKMIIAQPASFQIIWTTTITGNVSGLVMKGMGSIPQSRSRLLTKPAPPSICWKNAMTSTQERKCGR